MIVVAVVLVLAMDVADEDDDDDADDADPSEQLLINDTDDNSDSFSLAIFAFGNESSLFTFVRLFFRFFTLFSLSLPAAWVRTCTKTLLMLLLLVSLLLLLLLIVQLLLLLLISRLLLIWHDCDNVLSSENGFALTNERPLSVCISICDVQFGDKCCGIVTNC